MNDQPSAPGPGGIGGTIERGLALVLVGGLVFGIIATLKPFATAILFGSILAIALWPLRDRLKRAGLRSGLAAVLLLLLTLAAVVLPLLLIAPGLAVALQEGAAWLSEFARTAPPTAPAWLSGLPLVGESAGRHWARIAEARGEFGPLLAPYAEAIRGALVDVASGLADSALQMLLALVVATMLWTSGEAIGEALRHVAWRLGGRTGERALHASSGAVRAVAYGVIGTAAAQGVLAGIGYAVAGVPAPALLGFLTLVFSVSQILGPLIVVCWAGAAWWLFEQGSTAWAIFMGAWGLFVVSGSDNVLRPLLIKRGVEMPLSLIILGVFGGFVTFGFLGLFIGPTLLAVGLVLLRAWREAAAPPTV